jgi:nitrogen-specific signal transduction histidine kinase
MNESILDEIDDSIITINNNNLIININKSAGILLNLPKSQILGTLLSEFDLSSYKYKIVNQNESKTYIIKQPITKNVEDKDHNNLMEKECFLFNVSHEIRTPLNGIIGMTQILKDKVDINLKEYINIISTCGNQLMDILNDILDYAKISSGNISLVPSNFNLNKMIEEIHDIIIAKKTKNTIDITYTIDDDIPENIFCDLKRLKQILLNLISNGVKFTDSGSVKTSIRLVKRLGVKIYIEFSVKDTGIGIPSQYLEKIFQPYIQVNNQLNRKYEGTGLGLTISRQLARLLGGDINVISTLGQGSTFTLTIEAVDSTPSSSPIQIQQPRTPPSTPASTPPLIQLSPLRLSMSLNGSIPPLSPNELNFKDISCLVIDDNSNNRIMVYQLLSSLGVKSIIIVSSAEEAFLVINSYKFDIIFLDICMPKMDGINTCIELKKKIENPPPIIAMSSIDDAINVIPNNLFNDRLLKPIKKSQLHKIIEYYLSPR